MVENLCKKPYARESHSYGISMEAYEGHPGLKGFFDVLSTSVDSDGRTYISTMEAPAYPVLATQWHPEKNAFEWGHSLHIPHHPGALPEGAMHRSTPACAYPRPC